MTSMVGADAVREGWEAVSGGYDQAFGSSFTAIARRALQHADVQPGMRLLDVAAGSGALSIPAAELGAHVLATDLSPGMLALLRRRAHEAGVAGIRTAVMDGTDLDVEDQSFQRVCSQFGVMLFPDTDRGLAEMYRVTAPGGMGVVVIFGRPDLVTPIVLVTQALHAVLEQVDELPATRLQDDPMSLPNAMADAGYRDPRLHVLDAAVEVGSLAGAWETVSSGMGFLAMLLPRLPAAKVTAVRDAFIAAVADRYGPHVTQLPVEVVVGIGSRL
jgi:ubiquinone/menaquinone biosynthesis C-methylase UbiE